MNTGNTVANGEPDTSFEEWIDRQDTHELAMEFLWYEAGIDIGIANSKKLDEGAKRREQHIKDVLSEQITNGHLFEQEFEDFMRDKFEEGINAERRVFNWHTMKGIK